MIIINVGQKSLRQGEKKICLLWIQYRKANIQNMHLINFFVVMISRKTSFGIWLFIETWFLSMIITHACTLPIINIHNYYAITFSFEQNFSSFRCLPVHVRVTEKLSWLRVQSTSSEVTKSALINQSEIWKWSNSLKHTTEQILLNILIKLRVLKNWYPWERGEILSSVDL